IAGAKVKKGTPGKDKVTLEVEANGATQEIEVATVLVAAGRAVNTENIGLAECGVQVTDRGFIKVDQNLQTTAPGYYAIGDVAGAPMLAHKGMREGVTVTELIAGKKPHRSEEHTSELQSRENLVCRLLLEKKKKKKHIIPI